MSDSTSGQGEIQAGYYLWVVLPLVSAAALAQALIRMGLPVLYPFIQSEFGLSLAQVGLITSALAIGFVVVVLLAGWLTDNFGVKRMTTMSLLSVATVTFAFPLAYSFPITIVLVALIGIAATPVFPATTRAIMDWIPVQIRAVAMGIKQAGVPFGGALTAAVLPVLAISIGWRMAAASTGLLVLVTAIAFIFLYHDAPRSIQAVHKSNLTTLKTVLRNSGLVMTMIWGATLVGLQFIVLSYFMLFLIEDMELSPITAGSMLAIAQFSSIIARILWGAASDFVFHGRRIVVLVIIGFLTVLWMLGASLMGVGVPSAVVYLIAIIMGISNLSYHGVLHTLVGEQADAGQVGMTIGLASTLSHVSMMIMTPLFGYLVDITSSYSLAWRVAAAVALVCTLALMVFGKESQRR